MCVCVCMCTCVHEIILFAKVTRCAQISVHYYTYWSWLFIETHFSTSMIGARERIIMIIPQNKHRWARRQVLTFELAPEIPLGGWADTQRWATLAPGATDDRTCWGRIFSKSARHGVIGVTPPPPAPTPFCLWFLSDTAMTGWCLIHGCQEVIWGKVGSLPRNASQEWSG